MVAPARDLTRAQYRRKMVALGFTPQGILGYWLLPGGTVSVSDLNAPRLSNRSKLAYMVAQLEKHRAKGTQGVTG